jgi:hypothetical protein
MARATLTLFLDGGREITVSEQSATAIYGHDGDAVQAAQLAQLALLTAIKALGVQVGPVESAPDEPPAEPDPDGEDVQR